MDFNIYKAAAAAHSLKIGLIWKSFNFLKKLRPLQIISFDKHIFGIEYWQFPNLEPLRHSGRPQTDLIHINSLEPFQLYSIILQT